MAKVTTTIKKVQRTIEVEEKVYSLELSLNEARLLRTLTGNITGSGQCREIFNDIFYALPSDNRIGTGELFNSSLELDSNADSVLQ